jgi:hypothetical protein
MLCSPPNHRPVRSITYGPRQRFAHLRKLYHRSHFAPAPDAARRDGRLAPRRGDARPAAVQEPVPTAPASSFADLVSSLKTDQPPVQPIDLSNRSGRSQLLRCRRADALNVFEAVSNTDRAEQIGVKDGWRWNWPNEVAAEHRSAIQLRPSIRAASAFQSGNRFTRPAVRSRSRSPPISAYTTCVPPHSRVSPAYLRAASAPSFTPAASGPKPERSSLQTPQPTRPHRCPNRKG